MTRRLLVPPLLKLLLLSTLLCACAATQEAPPEQRLSPQQLQAGAGHFLSAFYSKQLEDALASSATPFYLNHITVLRTESDWRQTLEKVFLSGKPVPVEVLAFEPYPTARLDKERPNDLAKLIEFGFDNSEIWLATLLLSPENTRPMQEKVLLLLDRGSGKVIGFIQ